MAELRLIVGDLDFGARWESAAPTTVKAMGRLLPLRSRFIHVRWSGEAVWLPFGDWRPGIDLENHTSHPSPGMICLYPGGISECEVIMPYGGCDFASKVGPLAANHFASIDEDEGWRDRLRELGRRCLWEGAQAFELREA